MERTIVLFERCLVACALYEEMWLKVTICGLYLQAGWAKGWCQGQARYLNFSLQPPQKKSISKDPIYKQPTSPFSMWIVLRACLLVLTFNFLPFMYPSMPNIWRPLTRRPPLKYTREHVPFTCPRNLCYISNGQPLKRAKVQFLLFLQRTKSWCSPVFSVFLWCS